MDSGFVLVTGLISTVYRMYATPAKKPTDPFTTLNPLAFRNVTRLDTARVSGRKETVSRLVSQQAKKINVVGQGHG